MDKNNKTKIIQSGKLKEMRFP